MPNTLTGQHGTSDPTFRLIGSPKIWDRGGALTSTLHWFETELLTREGNLVGLMAVNRDVIGQAETLDRSDRTVLDMDSSESPVHEKVENVGSLWRRFRVGAASSMMRDRSDKNFVPRAVRRDSMLLSLDTKMGNSG